MSEDIDAARDTSGDDADDELLAELRTLAALVDPVPADAVAAARSAIAWRTIDAELAELTADSTAEPALAGVRGAAQPTMLSFHAPDLTVELEVLEQPDGRRRLIGQLVPPAPGTVEIRHRGGTASVTADELGRFRVEDVGAGPVSLRCSVGPHAVETDWFLV